jgi:hypothetical protein
MTYVVTDCITCGVVYTVPLNVYEAHRKSGGYHCCPNGHQQGWPADESEDTRIRRERDRLKQQLAQKDDEIRQQREYREAAERSACARKGQITKLRNRAAAGVCIHCNRTVSQMARHMATKHPGFKAEEVL